MKDNVFLYGRKGSFAPMILIQKNELTCQYPNLKFNYDDSDIDDLKRTYLNAILDLALTGVSVSIIALNSNIIAKKNLFIIEKIILNSGGKLIFLSDINEGVFVNKRSDQCNEWHAPYLTMTDEECLKSICVENDANKKRYFCTNKIKHKGNHEDIRGMKW